MAERERSEEHDDVASTSTPSGFEGRATEFFHVGITVSDVDRSIDFYHKVLGLEVEGRSVIDTDNVRTLVGVPFTELVCVFLALPGGGSLELLQYCGVKSGTISAPPSHAGSGHLCLWVEGLDAILARARARGGVTISAVPVPSTRYPGAKVVYLRDPDDFMLELIELHRESI